MTQAFNLSQLANNLNSSGQLDATDGLTNAVPVSNGGTGASTALAARTNLGVPSTSGTNATGTWAINISGNASTATTATTATTAGNGGVTSVNGLTGAVTISNPYAGRRGQVFASTTTFTIPDGVTNLKVTCIGGGGGSAWCGYSSGGGFGFGGYGGIAIGYITVTASATYTVTVGAGGAGAYTGIATTVYGGNGGTSSFGSLISATGGTGGTAGQDLSINGTSGSGTNGTISNYSIAVIGEASPNSVADFVGKAYRAVADAALVWSATSGFIPGARGDSGRSRGNGAVGGVVLVEW